MGAVAIISLIVSSAITAVGSPAVAFASGTWTKKTIVSNDTFQRVAMSSDGTRLAIASYDDGSQNFGNIYTSTDSGTNISLISGTNTENYAAIASNGDGTKLVAVGGGYTGSIRTSTNSGVTWTQQTSSNTEWTAVASNDDGTKLAATALNGKISVSSDSGSTWKATSSSNAAWMSIASSSDGTKLAATVNQGKIWTSSDSGTTWTVRSGPGVGAWKSISSSSDGTKLAAVRDFVYTSTNSGVTWTKQSTSGNRSWLSIASSSDGTKLAATASLGYVYTSQDSGATWTQQNSPGTGAWKSIASSSDGKHLAALQSDGSLWLFNDSPPLAPSITSVSPTSGTLAGGTSITLTGTGFATGATVTIGGSDCTSVVVVSATAITCVTPSGTSGAKDVVVTNLDTQTVTSTGAFTYTAPVLSASTPSIPNTNTGSTSVVQTETITNTGNADLVFGAGAVTVSGTNSGDFTIVTDGCSNQTVAPTGTCTVTYTFTPTGVGSRTANLVFASNEAGSPRTVALTGTGVGLPVLSASTPSIPNTNTGSTSVVQTETITNTGNADLVFGAGAVTVTGTNAADFTIVADNCSNHTVAPAGTCTVTYTFTPTGVGSRTANLVFTSNEAGGQSTATLNGAGVGRPVFSASTPSIPKTYVGATSAVQTETITNTGNADLVFGAGAVTKTGANAADFTILADNCSNHTVAPAGTCTVTYKFKSTVAGTRTANLVFASNAVSSPNTVVLSVVAMGVVTIKKIDSTSGSIKGHVTVEITGTGFTAGSTVTFGGLNAVVVKRTGTTGITVKTPAHSAGAVPVVVANADGGTATYNSYTYKK